MPANSVLAVMDLTASGFRPVDGGQGYLLTFAKGT